MGNASYASNQLSQSTTLALKQSTLAINSRNQVSQPTLAIKQYTLSMNSRDHMLALSCSGQNGGMKR
eukprot:16102616-Heterocapsa_arctica.AAC.1